MLFVHLDIIKDNKKRKSEFFWYFALCCCLTTCIVTQEKRVAILLYIFYWIQVTRCTQGMNHWRCHVRISCSDKDSDRRNGWLMDDLCTHRSAEVPEIVLSPVRIWSWEVEVTPKAWTKANRATPKKVHIQLSYARTLRAIGRVTVSRGGFKRGEDVVGRRCCWRSKKKKKKKKKTRGTMSFDCVLSSPESI